MNRKPSTIREAWKQASSVFRDKLGDEAEFTAELLLRHVLGLDRTAFFLRWDEPFPPDRREAWERAVARRLSGEPAQYIIGEQEFYGLAFRVTPDVLIPRPETELLVERVLAVGAERWPAEAGGDKANSAGTDAANRSSVPLVADIGTGSGAIAVTLSVKRPDWRIAAVDLSAAAIAVARENAERHGVAARIAWYEGGLLEPFVSRGLAPDVVVSNPPYIESGAIPALAEEVRDHEPRLALDGGADGLDCYRRMLVQIARLPRVPCVAAFETGAGQARAVAEMMRARGWWDDVAIVVDYAGIERHVIAVGGRPGRPTIE